EIGPALLDGQLDRPGPQVDRVGAGAEPLQDTSGQGAADRTGPAAGDHQNQRAQRDERQASAVAPQGVRSEGDAEDGEEDPGADGGDGNGRPYPGRASPSLRLPLHPRRGGTSDQQGADAGVGAEV